MSLREAKPGAIPKSMVFAWVSWRKIKKIWVSSETFRKNSPGAPAARILGRKIPFEGGRHVFEGGQEAPERPVEADEAEAKAGAKAEAEAEAKRGGGGREVEGRTLQ